MSSNPHRVRPLDGGAFLVNDVAKRRTTSPMSKSGEACFMEQHSAGFVPKIFASQLGESRL